MDISARIEEIMREKGVNKKVLSERLGISAQNVNSTVFTNPKFAVVEKVARALGVPMSQLVADGDDDKKTAPEGTTTFECPNCHARFVIKKVDAL